MKKLFATTAMAAGLLVGLLSIPALATNGTETLRYDTAMTPQYGSIAPYSGTLRLNVFSNGIVRGYYFSDDQSLSYVPVTGGTNGASIWFDIGRSGPVHVEGRMKDGAIVGTATDTGTSKDRFNFYAKLTR